MKKILLTLFLLVACGITTVPRESFATVAENNARDVYTGNGSSTVFPYTFRILAQTDLSVYVNGVLKALTTDYTVSGVGNDGGGSVTFLVAPTSGHQVLILRNVDISQVSIYTPNESFPATRVERDLDRQTMVNQMQQEELNRAVKLNPSVSGVTTSFTPVAGKCFGLNVGGTAITNFDCEGGGGGGTGDITDVLGTSGEITVTNPGGPSPQVGIASALNLSTKVLQGGSPLVFEGATSDGSETTVVVTDPTADRTFTIPNADSVAVQPSTAGANQFANGVSAAGVVAYAQPSFSNLSGAATRSQAPAQVAYEDETNSWTGNNTFLDEDGLKIVDGADNTRVGRFSSGNISGGATRTMSFPNLSGTLALADTAQTISGANTFSADQTFGTGARAIISNLGIRGTASDTNPACAGGDYTIYADLSEGKWKRCDNGVLADLGSSGGSDGQHQIDSVNVSTNDPINFQDTATIDFTNPSAGNIQAAIKNTSITDAMIAGTGITTRSKLPTEVVYDDEANVFTNTQSFTTPLDIRGGTAIVFEGATADGFETSLVITDPTADRTVTIPNASGEVSLLGQTISGSEMDNNTVGPTQIDETANYTWTGSHTFTGATVGMNHDQLSELSDDDHSAIYVKFEATAGAPAAGSCDRAGQIQQNTTGGSERSYFCYSVGGNPIDPGTQSDGYPGFTDGINQATASGAEVQRLAGTDGLRITAWDFSATFTNQPANDGVEVVSSNAGDTTQTLQICGTTSGGDERDVTCETITLNGTTQVSTVKTNWNNLLTAVLSATTTGNVTIREASGNATITTIAAGNTRAANLATALVSVNDSAITTSKINAAAVTVAKVADPLKTKSITLRIGSDTGSALVDTQDETDMWRNNIAAMTITEVWCSTDQGTGTINLQRDDGSAADILSSNLTCTTSGATGSIAGAEDNLAVGDKIDFVMVTAAASGTPKRITVSIKAVLD